VPAVGDAIVNARPIVTTATDLAASYWTRPAPSSSATLDAAARSPTSDLDVFSSTCQSFPNGYRRNVHDFFAPVERTPSWSRKKSTRS